MKVVVVAAAVVAVVVEGAITTITITTTDLKIHHLRQQLQFSNSNIMKI